MNPAPPDQRCEKCGERRRDCRRGPGTTKMLCGECWANTPPEWIADDWRRTPKRGG
jgi:hypothetical protein